MNSNYVNTNIPNTAGINGYYHSCQGCWNYCPHCGRPLGAWGGCTPYYPNPYLTWGNNSISSTYSQQPFDPEQLRKWIEAAQNASNQSANPCQDSDQTK